MSNIIDKITENFDSFSRSQKTVANYVMENTNALAFHTLNDFAGLIGVSTTTVIRFARMLGFEGYTELQKSIQQGIKNKEALPERLPQSTAEHMNLFRDSFENDIANINATFEALSPQELKKAVDALATATNIYCLGLRSSFTMAYYISSHLGQLRKNVRLIQSVGMNFPEEIINAQPGDVCIAFMFPRYSRQSANILTWFKKAGIKIVLITGQSWLELQNLADIILPCRVNGISFKNSYVAPMCRVNYLVAEVARKDYDLSLGLLKRTEEILEQGYYLGL